MNKSRTKPSLHWRPFAPLSPASSAGPPPWVTACSLCRLSSLPTQQFQALINQRGTNPGERPYETFRTVSCFRPYFPAQGAEEKRKSRRSRWQKQPPPKWRRVLPKANGHCFAWRGAQAPPEPSSLPFRGDRALLAAKWNSDRQLRAEGRRELKTQETGFVFWQTCNTSQEKQFTRQPSISTKKQSICF